jgi:hypothetical protein
LGFLSHPQGVLEEGVQEFVGVAVPVSLLPGSLQLPQNVHLTTEGRLKTCGNSKEAPNGIGVFEIEDRGSTRIREREKALEEVLSPEGFFFYCAVHLKSLAGLKEDKGRTPGFSENSQEFPLRKGQVALPKDKGEALIDPGGKEKHAFHFSLSPRYSLPREGTSMPFHSFLVEREYRVLRAGRSPD